MKPRTHFRDFREVKKKYQQKASSFKGEESDLAFAHTLTAPEQIYWIWNHILLWFQLGKFHIVLEKSKDLPELFSLTDAFAARTKDFDENISNLIRWTIAYLKERREQELIDLIVFALWHHARNHLDTYIKESIEQWPEEVSLFHLEKPAPYIHKSWVSPKQNQQRPYRITKDSSFLAVTQEIVFIFWTEGASLSTLNKLLEDISQKPKQALDILSLYALQNNSSISPQDIQKIDVQTPLLRILHQDVLPERVIILAQRKDMEQLLSATSANYFLIDLTKQETFLTKEKIQTHLRTDPEAIAVTSYTLNDEVKKYIVYIAEQGTILLVFVQTEGELTEWRNIIETHSSLVKVIAVT